MTPKPDPRALTPHPDDWAAWCEHPVTRFVATSYANAAAAQRDAWMSTSWGGGQCDPVALIKYRERGDAYMAFLETTLEAHAQHVDQT